MIPTKTIKTVIVTFIIYLLLTVTWACDFFPATDLPTQRQDILDKGIKKFRVHGVSAAIIENGQLAWKGVSGFSHGTVPVSPDMAFAIGSVTKTIVASLALKLADAGVLALDDEISDWIAPHPNIGPAITIRQLLGHTSGIANLWDHQTIWDDMLADRTRYWTPEEILTYLPPPQFEPGKGFHYSNINYLLLALIIEKATGESLADLLESRLFMPLGLDGFVLSQQQPLPENQVHIYGDDYLFGSRDDDITLLPRTSHESVIFGSGGIFTTAESLARFADALFTGKVLSTNSMTAMLDFRTFEPFANMEAYGLGVQQYIPDFASGKLAVGHGGASIGTSTYLIFLPDYQVTLVVMVNAFPTKSLGYLAENLVKTVIDDFDERQNHVQE